MSQLTARCKKNHVHICVYTFTKSVLIIRGTLSYKLNTFITDFTLLATSVAGFTPDRRTRFVCSSRRKSDDVWKNYALCVYDHF